MNQHFHSNSYVLILYASGEKYIYIYSYCNTLLVSFTFICFISPHITYHHLTLYKCINSFIVYLPPLLSFGALMYSQRPK